MLPIFQRKLLFQLLFLLLLNFWHGCTLLAKAECFKRKDRFNVNFKASQDYDFWLRMAADYNIGYLNQITVMSRQHSGQGSKVLNCRLDEILVFFNTLYREDTMIKLFRKMEKQYTYENVKPYIEYRMEKYKGLEEEMNAILIGVKEYLGMMERGELHFQN